MAVMESKEVLRQFRKIEQFAKDCGLEGYIIEENPALPLHSLLLGIPGEVEEGHYIVCNLMPIDEEEARYTHFLHIFYQIPYDAGGLDKLDLLTAVNAVNSVTTVGHFVYQEMEEEKVRIQFRCTVSFDIEEEMNGSTICECADFMLQYGAMMEEILAGLVSGMDLETILESEGLSGEEE